MSGKLICFEGLDGCGKSALAARYEEYLVKTGTPTQLVGFPSRTRPIGKLIRSGLQGEIDIARKAYLPLMIADAIEWEPRIRDWTLAGGVFLADRLTTFSAFVYQTEDHTEEAVTRAFTCYDWRQPDMTFLVDVPAATALARRQGRVEKDVVMEKDDLAYNERLRRKYLTLFARYKGMHSVLDGELPLDVLLKQCIEFIGI